MDDPEPEIKEMIKPVAEPAQRTMTLQCTVQDGQIWIGDSEKNVFVEPETLYE